MLPLRLLAAGIGVAAAGVSQLLPEGKGPNIYDRMVEWGLEPSVESLGYNAGDGIQLRLTRFAPAFIEGAASVIQSPGAAYVAFGVTTEDRLTDAGAKFRRLTEAQFWGVGIDSREDDKSNYEWEQIQLGGIWKAEVSDHLAFNSVVGWETNRTGAGHNDDLPDIRETFDPDSLYGSLGVVNYVVAGTKATVDFTHIDILQPRGVRFIGEAFYYGGTGSTDSDFLRLQGEVQGYIPFNQRQSFALRGLVETNPGWGQGVPFYYFAELGGDRDLRGFTTARFRDRDRLTWTVEWRYEAWRELQDRSRAEWFVFWDSGTVHGVTRGFGSASGSSRTFDARQRSAVGRGAGPGAGGAGALRMCAGRQPSAARPPPAADPVRGYAPDPRARGSGARRDLAPHP
jgi:hypothetical protein